MRALDFSTDALIQVLEHRFERVRSVCNPAAGQFPPLPLYRALLAYARPFVTNERLARLMDEARARHARQWNELLVFRAEHEPKIGDMAERLREVAEASGQELGVDDAVFPILQEVIRHPGLQQEKLRAVFAHVRPSAVDHPELWSELRRMQQEYNEITHLGRTHLERQSLLNYAEPFYGALLVGDLARAPEAMHDLREDPHANFLGRFVLDLTADPSSERTKDQRPYGLTPAEAYLAASAFHEWALERLLEQDVALVLLDRYRQRVERFERDEVLAVLLGAARSKRRNADEVAVRHRMNLYLHDHGMDPLPEVEIGVTRPDAHVRHAARAGSPGALAVTYEAKVVRPHDKPAGIRKRLQQGFRQAGRYAHGAGQSVGHLVVFWNHPAAPEVTRRHAVGGVVVHLVLIDLRGSPYSGPNGKEEVISYP